METNDMKRTIVTAISSLMIISLATASFSFVQAENPPGNPYSVYGWVTLNGNPATDGVKVIVSIQNKTDRSGLTHDKGMYTVDFDAMQGDTAIFTVYVYNKYVHPTNHQSFQIKHPSPYNYSIDLSVNATQNQNEGSGGGGGSTSDNLPPIADLSKGEPYKGFVGEPVTFDGSLSHDPGGTIVSWYWIFGDGGSATTKTFGNHTYSHTGTFVVTLKVTDDQGAWNTAVTTATITLGNRPPSTPILNGPHNGTHNNSYTYTATSTDPENSTLAYTFTWGDGMTNTSLSATSGIPVTMYHTWRHAGVYMLTVSASDGETSSTPTTMTVLMSVMWVDGLGYLIDYNGDGIYDAFYSNATGNITLVQRLTDGTYLIDTDGNGVWDRSFNPSTKDLTLYTLPPVGGVGNGMWILAGILGAILVMFLILLLLTRRSKKKQESETPPEPEPKPKGKSEKKK